MERKDFLKNATLAGLTGSVILSGCNTTPSDSATSYYAQDLEQLRNAAEWEAVTIRTYTGAVESGVLQDQATVDTVLQFRGHHEEHLQEFNSLLEQFGADGISVDNYNPDSRIGSVNSQEDAQNLAMTLEWEIAADYYTMLTAQLQDSASKELVANIYPLEVYHYVAYKQALGVNPAINSALFHGLDDDHNHQEHN